MTSLRQIEANRRNALKSTGPTTPEGKERSSYNAVRHGLTAETVIAVLESSDDYEAFEATVISDYNAETAVERQLVLRCRFIARSCTRPGPENAQAIMPRSMLRKVPNFPSQGLLSR
jgi:hypothetical protein